MKLFFVVSLLISFTTIAMAACSCRAEENACLQTCVTSANNCIQNCQGSTQCYSSCIDQYWPTNTIPVSSAVATSPTASASSVSASATSTAVSQSVSQSASRSTTTTQSATTTTSPDGSGATKLSAHGLIVAVLMTAFFFH